MTQQAEHEAALAERRMIEKARDIVTATQVRMTEWFGELHAALDERETKNRARCPHLRIVRGQIGEFRGVPVQSTVCEACGEYIPEAVAKEGEPL